MVKLYNLCTNGLYVIYCTVYTVQYIERLTKFYTSLNDFYSQEKENYFIGQEQNFLLIILGNFRYHDVNNLALWMATKILEYFKFSKLPKLCFQSECKVGKTFHELPHSRNSKKFISRKYLYSRKKPFSTVF
jgi:hypothetical protein